MHSPLSMHVRTNSSHRDLTNQGSLCLYLLYIFSWAITGAAEIVYFRRSYKKVILAAQSW